MYAIATEYYGKEEGESSFDPLFVIAAILDWAGIARNERGYMELINVASGQIGQVLLGAAEAPTKAPHSATLIAIFFMPQIIP